LSEVVSKSTFAALASVSPARVSQWISEGKLSGDALVGDGRRAGIRVTVALEQLKRRLDTIRHVSASDRSELGLNSEDERAAGVDADLKRERLTQLRLQNQRALEEQLLRSGRFMLAADARVEMGRFAKKMIIIWQGWVGSLGATISANFSLPPRDVNHVLRLASRELRTQAAKEMGGVSAHLPAELVTVDVDEPLAAEKKP
jgi:hypothetical protein